MANDIFRFYADDPEFIFAYLREHWRKAVVRWDSRKVGASDIWLTVIVLDQATAAADFRSWLGKHGKAGDLVIRKWPFRTIMAVPNTVIVRKRWRILSWLRLRALRIGSLS